MPFLPLSHASSESSKGKTVARYRYFLAYEDEGQKTTLTLTEKDFREWLDQWPDYVKPVEITIERRAL